MGKRSRKNKQRRQAPTVDQTNASSDAPSVAVADVVDPLGLVSQRSEDQQPGLVTARSVRPERRMDPMPAKSQAQFRAMQAAAHDNSTLGIPASVGKEVASATPAVKALPEKVGKRRFAIKRKPRAS